MLKYKVAKYERLSDADRDNKQVSDSIENQNMMIDNYLKNHPEMEIYDTYIDDGKTGMNYERPGFRRMMHDVDAGKVNLIIVKDLSRIGREHCETIQLLKKEFPLKNIRFIAIADNIDMNGSDYNVNAEGIEIPFKVIVNDWYSHNISIQIRNSQNIKRINGLFIGSHPPYGYLKDPNNRNHLIIDAVPADIVRRIYNEFLEGKNIKGISGMLNMEKVLCPSQYKKQILGVNYTNARSKLNTDYWTYSTIKYILKHEVYIGNLVQHKKEKVAYNLNKYRIIPLEERCRVENTHEPIIENEKFELVQKFMKQRSRQVHRDIPHHKYAGLFYCGDCGHSMSKTTNKTATINIHKFRCGQYARVGRRYCTAHTISFDDLDDIVLEKIQENIAEIIDDKNISEIAKLNIDTKINNTREESVSLNLRLNELLNEKKQMLTNLSKKIIAEEDYILYNSTYDKEVVRINDRMKAIEDREMEESFHVNRYNEWMGNFLKFRNIKTLNRDVLIHLVERIEIFEDKTMEIKFRFSNPFVNK